MRFKKQVIAAGIAATTVIAASPAFGGFSVVVDGTKAQSVAQVQKPNNFAEYTILERADPTVAPVPAAAPSRPAATPVPAAAPALPPAFTSPARIVKADLRMSDPSQRPAALDASPQQQASANGDVRRLEAASEEIETKIEQLRYELANVRNQLQTLKTDRRKTGFVQIADINRKIGQLEQQMVEVGRAVLTVRFGSRSKKFEPSEHDGRELVAAGKSAAHVSVTGHTDNVGSPERNRIVAMARAVSAKVYMSDRGVAARKISVASQGSNEPVGDNDTEEGRAANRRVEIEFQR